MGKHKPVRLVSFVGLFLAASFGGFVACSGGGGSGDDDDGGGGASGQGGAAGFGGQPFAASGGFPGFNGAGGGGQGQSLTVDPPEVTLTATGMPVTQAFVAKLPDGTAVQGAAWTVDDVSVGLISAGGVFGAKGFSGGEATVTASYNGLRGTAKVRVVVDIVGNDGGVTPGDQGKLDTGGTADSKLGFLYPYDATVFPRGVGAPLVQLAGAAATGLRVLVETENYRYKGYFVSDPAAAAKGLNRLQLPDQVWQGLVATAKPGVPVKVSATTLVGGNAAGPVSETWSIAAGSLKGIVYYNTYQSPLANNEGAVMTIKPGGQAEVLLKGCTVCHSVSSQGNRMVASINWADSDLVEPGEVTDNPIDSASYELRVDGSAVPKAFVAPPGQPAGDPVVEDGRNFSFGGLTPEGKWFLSNGVPPSEPGVRGLTGALASRLIETDTGVVVPTPSLQELGITYAMTPAFSHDGALVAFNRRDVNNGKTLSVLNFNGAVNPPVFSNVVDLVTLADAGAKDIAAWPSFLPDNKALVYHEGTSFDTYDNGSKAHIRLVDIATKSVVKLARLNGERPDGSGHYLPLGAAEGDMNFEPTVLPVPVGGYYWVFFTSRRTYGNTISPGGVEARGDDIYGGQENPSPRKKIWVAAIDLDYAERLALQPGQPNYDPNYDPSHPAFFVTGQEIKAGNMRAFAALEPCRGENVSCESSTECCDGRSCLQTVDGNGQPVLQCANPPPAECAREEESCTTTADCCNPNENVLCINGRCAIKPPVIR